MASRNPSFIYLYNSTNRLTYISGIYLVLICLCLYSLRARSYQGETKLHLLTMFTLFALSSAHITGIFVTMLPLMKASFGSLGDDGNEEDALMNFMKASVEFTTIGTAIYMTSKYVSPGFVFGWMRY